MARAGRGERSPAEDREEEAARAAIMQFLKQHFR
jgi:hypothetical protein